MMRSNPLAGNPEFKKVVDSLLLSVANFDRYENRSAIRQSLVLPVRVTIRDRDAELPGLTRNVSLTGVGLLLPTSCEAGSKALITIERTDGNGKSSILSECRWCKPYGEVWYFSGWQFIKVQRG